MSSFFNLYSRTYKLWPYTIAFGTAALRGSFADGIVQKQFDTENAGTNSNTCTDASSNPTFQTSAQSICYHNSNHLDLNQLQSKQQQQQHQQQQEKATSTTFDWMRNFRFALYNGLHGGWFQHALYNKIFPYFIPALTFQATIIKLLIDVFVHVPFIYFPSYYAFKSMIDGQSPIIGIKQYWNQEKWDVLKPCWTIWIPIMFGILHFVRPELRVGILSIVSVAWLMILTYKSPIHIHSGSSDKNIIINMNEGNNVEQKIVDVTTFCERHGHVHT